jgi:signal transduction histidine kinase
MPDATLLGAVDSCLSAATTATVSMRGGPSGDSHWLASIARLPQADGTSLARIIIRDESEYFQTEQIRREFVANASHELRTPLTIVHGYIESLLDGAHEDPDLAQRFLKTARRHTRRMARLIEDMLTISKLESHAAGLLRSKEFSIGKCLQRVVENLGPLIEQQHVRIDRDIDPRADRLIGDRFYWEQILFNLIENAIKINQAPGLVVKVAASRRPDGMVEIVVEDNGMGIPRESLPFIFKRFYRVQKDHSNEVPGTGLGLSIVNRAVEAHGGSIRVESDPGRRTAFTITLPPDAVAGIEAPAD